MRSPPAAAAWTTQSGWGATDGRTAAILSVYSIFELQNLRRNRPEDKQAEEKAEEQPRYDASPDRPGTL